ncbi:hypothetical protein Sp245p_26170 (plasmid) [Azospirillum baldaniorum]|uniref:Uncharacterized protein n=1 Tax=Azospirillum baldaniorum TaxID=1064539 RepID=A0A9P1NRQ5_9PROT|nr:hypothetical protein [Azospirillum baldaniorum]AWJ93310.1 hypothetical protein Sp245p_26170 [Azospirillum baldaniorum]TWA78012.1 hypothetical protein FBZ85_106172 [Azospirillum brasilense]CCD02886.1 protein of unknown function [Azospirillum baldaniorum]
MADDLTFALEAIRELVDDLRRDAELMSFEVVVPEERLVGNEAAAFIERAAGFLEELAKAGGPTGERASAILRTVG